MTKFKQFSEPRTHIVVDNFFTDVQLNEVLKEIQELSPYLKQGLAHDEDRLDLTVKNNLNLWFDDHYGNRRIESKFLTYFRDIFWSREWKDFFNDNKDPIYNTLTHTTRDNSLLSVYGDENFYDWHKDNNFGLPTVVIMLCNEPQQFEGGDFILKFDGKQKRIKFKNNRLLIFPSRTDHKATKVTLKSNNIKNMRYTIQYWAKGLG